jgi:putative nucleotidyltransferase with HDIG domain
MGMRGPLNAFSMRLTTRTYVSVIGAATALAVVAVAVAHPSVTSSELGAVAFFSALAIGAEMLSFVLARKVRGSIAFIPYLAAVLVAPTWAALVAVILVKLVTERLKGLEPLKAVFNACTHALTLACAMTAYRTLGGIGFLDIEVHELGALTTSMAFPAIAAFATSFVVNLVLVGGVIAVDTGEKIGTFLRSSSLTTIGSDLLTTPIVFVFSWLYTSYGAMAAAAAWVPIVGIRHLNRVQLELEETNKELLQLMVKSIEARDPYTSGHSRRVSKYAAAIATAMGLPRREVDSIETAALLHDVGKIYEKYAPILTNPGRLTPDEWVTMQEHPIDGANLVATITRMRYLVPAVRHHHENWDGTGYPDKIAGEAIPLASRIIMFADTIDAMTSERPYRGALTEGDVRTEILRGRGKQFDPDIADRLLAAGIWRTLFGDQTPKVGFTKLSLVTERETA